MKNITKSTSYILSFFGGIVFAVLILIVMAYLSGPNFEMRKDRIYEYGNIKCMVRQLSNKEIPKSFDATQVIEIFEDINRKLSLFLDQTANVTAISFNHADYSILHWQKREGMPIEQFICYGGASGEIYYDLDVDGQFDLKFIVDDTNQTRKRYIFIDEGWIEVEKADFKNGLAQSDSLWFKFEFGRGWVNVVDEN